MNLPIQRRHSKVTVFEDGSIGRNTVRNFPITNLFRGQACARARDHHERCNQSVFSHSGSMRPANGAESGRMLHFFRCHKLASFLEE